MCLVYFASSGANAANDKNKASTAATQNLDDLLTTSADLYSSSSSSSSDVTVSTPDYIGYLEEPTEAQSFGISMFSAALPSKNYSFDVSKIDWYTDTPSAVTKLYTMTLNQNPSANTLQPIISVFVTSDTRAVVFAGVNFGPMFRAVKQSGSVLSSMRLGYLANMSYSYSSHYCYRAVFNSSGKLAEPWTKLDTDGWGADGNADGKIYTFVGTTLNSSHVRDIYYYGVNGFCFNYTAITFLGDTYEYISRLNWHKGGFDDYFVPTSDGYNFPNLYQQSFIVPSVEQWQAMQQEQQHEETKGILGSIIDKIKEIPTLIIDGLKSLFVPSDGFFTTYFNELNAFFKDRFGFLYELPEFAITLFQKLIDFNPDTSGYSMTFPKLQAPEVVNGDVIWHDVSDEQTFDFSFLEEQPFKTLYSVYKSLIWLGYCVLLLNLIKRKSESVFGGGTE